MYSNIGLMLSETTTSMRAVTVSSKYYGVHGMWVILTPPAKPLESHEDDISLLTDCESTLQAIHKWVGCRAKLNLSKSPDADVLKKIIIKLAKESPSGSSDSTSEGQSPQGGPTQ